MQALEEENLDLMQENKELRKEISVHRLEVEKLKATMIKQQGLRNNNSNDVVSAPFVVASSSSTAQDNIENMPLNIQHANSNNNGNASITKGSNLPATAEKVLKKRVLDGGGDDGDSYSNTNNRWVRVASISFHDDITLMWSKCNQILSPNLLLTSLFSSVVPNKHDECARLVPWLVPRVAKEQGRMQVSCSHTIPCLTLLYPSYLSSLLWGCAFYLTATCLTHIY